MTMDAPISALVGAAQVGKAVGDVTHAVRALMDGVQLLGPRSSGRSCRTPPRPSAPNRGRDDHVDGPCRGLAVGCRPRRAQAAVQRALPALKEAKKDHDFKAAAHSLIDIVGGLGSELQKPEVQQMATAASALFIESAAATLGAKAVQDGDASPTEAVKGAAAMSQAVAVGVFGDKLKDPAVAGNLKEAAAALQSFGGPLLSSPQAQEGLDQLLRGLGRTLQDPATRETFKGAVATLVQTAGTVGGSLQNGRRNEAFKSGAGFLIEAVGNRLQNAPEPVA